MEYQKFINIFYVTMKHLLDCRDEIDALLDNECDKFDDIYNKRNDISWTIEDIRVLTIHMVYLYELSKIYEQIANDKIKFNIEKTRRKLIRDYEIIYKLNDVATKLRELEYDDELPNLPDGFTAQASEKFLEIRDDVEKSIR